MRVLSGILIRLVHTENMSQAVSGSTNQQQPLRASAPTVFMLDSDAFIWPHLIQIFPPLRVKYWPHSDCTAVHLMEAASEPLEGSVRQNAAMFSPTERVGKKTWVNDTY